MKGENPGWYENDLHYDASKNTWYVTYHELDEHGEETKKIVEYTSPFNEYDIEKNAKRFLSQDNKNFFFSPARLTIQFNEDEYSIDFKDIHNSVVIYDKFLTEESIFEKDNIGVKSLITCSYENEFGTLKETKYQSNNFFYDICFIKNYSENYPRNSFIIQKENEAINNLKDKVDEYKHIALNNPDKAYFLFLEAENSNAYISQRKEYNSDNGFPDFIEENTSLLICDFKEKLLTCDIKEKDKTLEDVLNCYRYYNLAFYGTIYSFLYNSENAETLKKNIPLTEKIETHFYDILTQKEPVQKKVTTNNSDNVVQGRFRGISGENLTILDFDSYPDLKILNSDGTVNRSYSDSTNSVSTNSTISNSDETSYSNSASISNETYIENDEILPSNTRKLEQSDIEDMNKDQLYLAYNEIFARHGHDFKTAKFKDYFSTKTWYHPETDKVVSMNELSEIERYNANLLKAATDSK